MLPEEIEAVLRRPRWSKSSDAAIEAAVGLGAEGDALLARLLPEVAGSARMEVVWALRDTRGENGDEALRRLFRNRETGTSRDLRSAALGALVERLGPGATVDLRSAMKDRDGQIRLIALRMAANTADRSAVPEALELLKNVAAKRSNAADISDVMAAVIYLARHLEADDEVWNALVDRLRSTWSARTSGEASWLVCCWPDIAPGGPEPAEIRPPDVTQMTAWLKQPGPLL